MKNIDYGKVSRTAQETLAGLAETIPVGSELGFARVGALTLAIALLESSDEAAIRRALKRIDEEEARS